MSIECGYCERDLRGPHDEDCPRYEATKDCTCDPEWQPDCTVHNGGSDVQADAS